MLHNFTAGGLILAVFFVFSSQSAFAQTKNDWNRVVSQVDSIVAVRTADGQTVFGKLTAANDNEITLQIADKKELTSRTSSFQRSAVRKVWTAELRNGKGWSKPTTAAVGAGVGAGIGAGIGLGALGATGGSDSGGQIVGVLIAAGAGLGAVAGYFAGKGGHKKTALIYET